MGATILEKIDKYYWSCVLFDKITHQCERVILLFTTGKNRHCNGAQLESDGLQINYTSLQSTRRSPPGRELTLNMI